MSRAARLGQTRGPRRLAEAISGVRAGDGVQRWEGGVWTQGATCPSPQAGPGESVPQSPLASSVERFASTTSWRVVHNCSYECAGRGRGGSPAARVGHSVVNKKQHRNNNNSCNSTRINSVFYVLKTANLLLPRPVFLLWLIVSEIY